jgi:hypothetical protein
VWFTRQPTVHTSAYGEELGTHICTIVDVLAVQLRATYEVAREDGGWNERSLWCFLRDVQWDLARQCWTGSSGG